MGETKVAVLRDRIRMIYKVLCSTMDSWATQAKRLQDPSGTQIKAPILPGRKMSLKDKDNEGGTGSGNEGGSGSSSSDESGKTKITLRNCKEFLLETCAKKGGQPPSPGASALASAADKPAEENKLLGALADGETNGLPDSPMERERINANATMLTKAYKVISDRFPESAEYPIRDPEIFRTAFRQQLTQ